MRNRSLRRLRWRVAVRTNSGVALYRRAPGSCSYTFPRAHWTARYFSRQDAAHVLRLRQYVSPLPAPLAAMLVEGGLWAGRAGLSLDCNPHRPGTEAHACFERGWVRGVVEKGAVE